MSNGVDRKAGLHFMGLSYNEGRCVKRHAVAVFEREHYFPIYNVCFKCTKQKVLPLNTAGKLSLYPTASHSHMP